MSTKYTVVKIGQNYQTVRRQAACGPSGLLQWTGGLLAAICGLRRRDTLGTLLVGAGGWLIYNGVRGHNPLRQWWRRYTARRQDRREDGNQAPSYHHGGRRRAGQIPIDKLDEAMMESFPASDPH